MGYLDFLFIDEEQFFFELPILSYLVTKQKQQDFTASEAELLVLLQTLHQEGEKPVSFVIVATFAIVCFM